MSWRNDPAFAAVPVVGEGSVDIGKRTMVGEAVTYDGSEVDALIAFLGDDQLVNFDGQLYRKTAEGQLHPIVRPLKRMVVVKPPAGDWFFVNEAELTTEFAIHVNAPGVDSKVITTGSPISVTHALSGGSVSIDKDNVITRHAPAVKKAAPKVAPKKK